MNLAKKPFGIKEFDEPLYDIVDKHGFVLPRHYSGRGRTAAEVGQLINHLNINGEHAPYKTQQIA